MSDERIRLAGLATTAWHRKQEQWKAATAALRAAQAELRQVEVEITQAVKDKTTALSLLGAHFERMPELEMQVEETITDEGNTWRVYKLIGPRGVLHASFFQPEGRKHWEEWGAACHWPTEPPFTNDVVYQNHCEFMDDEPCWAHVFPTRHYRLKLEEEILLRYDMEDDYWLEFYADREENAE